MKINNIIKINFLFVILSLFACESLEDTYKDYSGDGKIKYVSKCESFTVSAGWKRFVFNWEPSVDPNIKEVQIHWSCEVKKGVFTIPVGENTFTTEATFEDYSYTFECYGVDVDNNLSIPLIEYSRPYTYTHDLVLGAPKMVNKYFFLGNDKTGRDLVMFFDPLNDKANSTTVSYFKDGEQVMLQITEDMFLTGNFMIENIDYTKDIVVNRVGRVEGCLDDVTFEPFVLEHDVFNIDFDFRQEIKDKYNLDELSNEFINNLEVLELDYSLKSLEDVMYFPNLKKVILGGNRYTIQRPDEYIYKSAVDNPMIAALALNNVNRKLGTEIIIHNNHYNLGFRITNKTEKGNPELPVLQYLSTEGWSVKSSTNEGVADDDPAKPGDILDNDPNTTWHPQPKETTIRIHELVIDMQSEKIINGFKVTQPNNGTPVIYNYLSDIIRIEISNDKTEWENALFQFQPKLGNNFGESVVLRTQTPKTARYIKITLPDKYSSYPKGYCVGLGDFMVF